MRHLPHWRQPGATYFVTFRLADSLPASKLRELRAIRSEWERKYGNSMDDAAWHKLAKSLAEKLEYWLDQGMGSCLLRERPHGDTVTEALYHFDGNRYHLGCFVVMPNHVHLIVRPFDQEDDSLERILQSWKRHAAMKINRRSSRTGPLWQQESYD